MALIGRGRAQAAGARERRTLAIAVLAGGTTAAVVAGELARVWRQGSAPLPAQTDDVIGAAEEAARQTVAVAIEGYRESPRNENSLLSLLGSFTLTFGLTRASAHLIRRRGPFGPFRDLVLGERHIHHFVPGIALVLVAGAAAIISRDERLDPLLAVPFGAGAALTLDESALLLELRDVYWTEGGIISVQIALATTALLASLTLALRLLRRGE
ncbi:MAG TPA: hypothetical protein VHE14_06305, partial [Solirubrobacteraceae bacterium]|nr:hypothetical protein [Solirubrobacteraceae bacterium]